MKINPPVQTTLTLLVFLVFLSTTSVFVSDGWARPVARGHHSKTIVRTGPAASGSVHRHHQSRNKRRYEQRKDFRDDVRRDRWRWRVGTSLTAAAFRNMSCRSEVIVIGNVTYYRCGTGWYRRAYSGGTVTYIVVEAPASY